MTGPVNTSVDAMAEQLSEIINNSPAPNFKLLLRIYYLKNKKHHKPIIVSSGI